MNNRFTFLVYFFLFIVLASTRVEAFASNASDYFRSKQTGNYSQITTWESSPNQITWSAATIIPSAPASQILIRGGHEVTVTDRRNVDDLVVENGSKLIISSGVVFSIFNGPASIDAAIYGILNNAGTITTDGVLLFQPSGIYQHNYTTTGGNIPVSTWLDGSRCEIVGYTNYGNSIYGLDQSFYDLTWNCPNQIGGAYPSFSPGVINVRNTLSIINTGNGILRLTSSVSGVTLNAKNFLQTGGTLSLINSTDVGLNAKLNLTGNFTMQGGVFQKGTGGSTGTLAFAGTDVQFFNKTGGYIAGKVDVFINEGSSIDFGTSVLNGTSGSFNLNANATLITANTAGITTSGSVGSIQNTGTRTFNTTASYNYNGTSSQNTGNGLPATVKKLIINNGSGVILRSGTITVTDSLYIMSGSLNLGTNQLVSNNGSFGTGTIFTQNTSTTPLSANKNWAGTISYNGNGAQTIVNGNYTNLNGTGGARILSSNISISDTFTPGDPNVYTIAGSTINFNGAGAQNIPNFNYNNLNGTGGNRILDTQINIAGTFTPGDLNLYTTTGSTINFNGAGAQNIPAFNFNNLACSNSGTKTVTGEATVNNSLAVNNSAVLNANGSLTLLATATSNANVAALSGSADIIGNVNVQSYLYGEPSGALRGTKSMSSPINDAAVVGAKTFEQLKNYIIITGPNGTTNGFDAGPGPVVTFNPVTLNFYTESTSPSVTSFTPVPSITTNTTPGTGFLTFFRGNRSGIYDAPGKLKSPFSAAEDVLVTYTGPINKGDINVNVGYTNYGDAYDGFYLAGNPYPATIDWDALRSASLNMGSSITIVTGGKANATYNAVGGVAANGGSRYIQPGQGFYVQANSGGGILRFKENQKNIVEAPARLLSLPTQPSVVVMNNKLNTLAAKSTSSNLITNNIQSNTSNKILRMTLKSDDFEEETVVVFDDQFSEMANENDSKYFPGFDVSLATLSADNKPMAINLMPDVNNVTDIKLSITAKSSGNMELNFGELSLGYLNNLWLEDSYLNTIVQVNQGYTYNFDIDKNNTATFGNNRLKILVAPPTTLAVTYTKFDAKKVNQGVALQWSTVNENNNKGFEVERAADKEQIFTKIAFIPATDLLAAEANYSYLDDNPLLGNNYYRLKQIDNNGKFDYSSLKYVNFGIGNQDSKITLYPNPTSSYFKITDLKDSKGAVQLNILNLNGTYLKKAVFSKGQELKQDVSTLPNGMYLVEVLSNEGVLLSLNKFIKN